MKRISLVLALCLLLAMSANPVLAQNVGLVVDTPTLGGSQNVIYGNAVGGGAGNSLMLLRAGGSQMFRVDVSGNVNFNGTLQAGSIPYARLTGVPSFDTTDDNWSGNSLSNTATINNSYPLVMGSDGMLKVKSLATVNGSETVSLQTSIDGRTDDYTIGSYGGEGRHLLVLQPQGGYVGIGNTAPGYKLDVSGTINSSGGLISGGVDNGSVIFYRTSNPYSLGNTDSVLTVSDRSNSDWGITADKTGYDYGLRVNVTSGANYAITTYNGSSYPFRVDGTGKTFLPEISHSNGRVYLAGNLHIDSYNGNQIYMNHYSSANTMVGTGGGNLYVGTDSPPSAYRIFGVANRGSDWGFRFNNDANGSNVHIAHGGGYGMHVNAGSNASTGTYIFEGYGAGASRFYVNGVGDLRVGASSDRYVDAGRLYLNNSAWHGWGTSIIDGRVWSANSNIHLSPPTGYNVVINTDYRDAGGSTGTAGLTVSGSGTFGQRLSVGQSNPGYTLSSIDTSGSGSNMEVRGPQCSSVTQALNVKASCNTGSASNGFGTGINFGTSDTGTTCGWPNIDCSYTLGTINVVRTGGSQTGDMYFMTSNGGSLSEKFRIYAGGDFRSVGNLTMNNGSPTIYFQDSDNRSAMIHNNSNIFYVLRGCGNNSTSWCTYNGVWPLEINLENNNASFGGDIYSTGAGKWLSNTITKSGDTVDGVIYFRSNKGSGSYVGSNSSYQLEAYSSDGGAAGMSFHRGGYYAVNMGLDPDNVFRIGGWSAGSNRWQLDMSGNETLAGNLYANGGYVYGAGGAIYLQDLNGSGSRNTSVNGALLRSGMVMGNSTIGYGLHLNSHLWNWGGDPMYFTAGNFQFRTVIGNNNYTNLGNFSGDASNWNINQNNVTDTWMNFNGGSYARFIMSASGDWDGRNIWTWYVRTEPTPHKLRLISDTGAEVVTFANNGNVGFGLGGSNPSYRLQLASDSAGKPNGGSWANSSDQRLKKDVKDISGQEALDKLSKLQGKTFEWINPEEHSAKSGEVRASVMAQNLKEVFPQWVTEIDASGKDKGLVGSDGKAYSISYPNDFNAYLIEAIKELKKQNEELSQKVKDLEAAIK
jgi:hypothetical protein